MNRKTIYGIIAIVIVVVLISSVIGILTINKQTSANTISVSSSTSLAQTGQNISFYATLPRGTANNVIFNFGDGFSANTTYSASSGKYITTHSYEVPGKYLVTASATLNSVKINNMADILPITITASTVTTALATEITVPVIVSNSQIFTNGTAINLVGSFMEPPTASNWTIGYYIWNFGNGKSVTDPAIYNSSSGSFNYDNVSYNYNSAGIYVLSLTILTFNSTNYVTQEYLGSPNLTYYPISLLHEIIASGQYQNSTVADTMVIVNPGTVAQIAKTSSSSSSSNEIINAELQPGGPYSFDPDIDSDLIGYEIILNVYENLFTYNGSSMNISQMIPMVASEIPTVANGGISANYTTYTIHIRSGLKFANGDPLTAWDVYASYVRDLIFVQGAPSTNGRILATSLLPGGGYAPNANSYQNITSAITLNNATQTVTFHLLRPDPIFIYYLASSNMGSSVLDYNWLAEHGAGINFTPAGFLAYQQYGNEVNYNTYIQWNTMGSGPYIIKNFMLGQSITLGPNPYYTPIPGVPGYGHKANDTIYIEWIKDPSTELLMLKSGLADIFSNLPSYDFPTINKYVSAGKIAETEFSSLNINSFAFNFDVNETLLSTLGSGYHIPQYYFSNMDVRRAFAYAFNYDTYINSLMGNKIYGVNFGFHYTGAIPEGLLGYMSPQQLAEAGINVPTYNITIAKQYLYESGIYNQSIDIPVVVYAGDPVDFAAADMWAQTLSAIDPNIVMTPLYLQQSTWYGYLVPNMNPMPIYFTTWYAPDYPFATDYLEGLYQESGFYASSSGFNPTVLNLSGHPNQTLQVETMNEDIGNGMNTGNLTQALIYYDNAEKIAVNMTSYVYLAQLNWFWLYSPSLSGIQYEQNPMVAGGGDMIYIYLSLSK
ncbi:MAG: ABC transporter substrate-binding protein [Thermoplasmata archaeon]